MSELLSNLRFALRRLRKNPGSALVVVLVLALGTGAPITIFCIFNTLVLRPLSFPEPDRLVRIYETFPLAAGQGTGGVSIPNFLDWRERSQTLEDLAAYTVTDVNFRSEGLPQRLHAVAVTANLFQVLGVQAQVGRTFGSGEDRPGAPPVVVLSHDLGRRQPLSDQALLGSDIVIDGTPRTVVGIMPADFRFPPGSYEEVDLWLPLQFEGPLAENRTSHWLSAVARLAPEASLGIARDEMDEIARVIEEEHPVAQQGRGAHIASLQQVVTERIQPALLMILGASVLFFLIACSNAASLVLARSVARRRELAIRTALGAGPRSLAGLFTGEAALLALGGLGTGGALAWAAIPWIVRISAEALPQSAEMGLDLRLALFVLGVAISTVLTLGLSPMLEIRRGRIATALKDGGGSATPGVKGRNFRGLLIVIQTSLCLVLLTATGLLIKTVVKLITTEAGMASERILTVRASVPEARYPPELAAATFFEPARLRIAALPEIAEVGWINLLPLEEWGWNGPFHIEGRPEPQSAQETPFAEWRFVSPGYFATLEIPVLEGRDLQEGDLQTGAPWVAVINSTLAERYFPDEDPVGRAILLGGSTRLTIAGVVGSVRQRSLDRPPVAEIYIPYTLGTQTGMTLVARTRLEPLQAVPAVRAALLEIDPEQPIYNIRTMEEVVSRSITDRRLYLQLLAVFAALALVLAAAATYGLVSYLVNQRRREIGIRLALGAGKHSVLRQIAREGLELASLGILFGIPASLSANRILSSLLYGVRPYDPLVLGGVAFVLALTALAASYLPARRATRVDPADALQAS